LHPDYYPNIYQIPPIYDNFWYYFEIARFFNDSPMAIMKYEDEMPVIMFYSLLDKLIDINKPQK